MLDVVKDFLIPSASSVLFYALLLTLIVFGFGILMIVIRLIMAIVILIISFFIMVFSWTGRTIRKF